ncbi:MAG TPA: TspO/MBR family protein [Candidatus Dormibacteraeota bacterium]|nr:TspO/MBR family protein [Candidatus Dormibacteraeota bacterium]
MRLIVSIAVCLAAAGLGSLLTTPALQPWYASLSKPRWTPPNWLFGPVWTILYLAMGVAAWLVWREDGLTAVPMRFFLLQLLLNVAWSGLFFRLRSPGLAFGEIVVLWFAILATTIEFWAVVPAAGWLLLPYLIWVGYATALNFSIWKLNP